MEHCDTTPKVENKNLNGMGQKIFTSNVNEKVFCSIAYGYKSNKGVYANTLNTLTQNA